MVIHLLIKPNLYPCNVLGIGMERLEETVVYVKQKITGLTLKCTVERFMSSGDDFIFKKSGNEMDIHIYTHIYVCVYI